MSEATTLRTLIGIGKDEVEHALSLHAKEDAGMGSKLGSATGFIAGVAAEKVNSVLDVDTLEVLGQAWAKLQLLREYADPKKHPAGQTSVVRLGQHDVTHSCDPVLALRAAGVKLTELKLALELDVRLRSVALSITDGRVMGAAPGEASVIARLKYKSVKLKEQSTPSWKLPGEIKFREGIRIPA
jgi:hypothetical protein